MQRIRIEEFIDWINSMKPGSRLCVTFHRNGDPDALASALGIKELVGSVNSSINVKIMASEGINLLSKTLLAKLNIREAVLDPKDASSCNYFVIVDTSTLSQLGDLGETVKNREYAIIDHHEVNELINEAIVALHDPYRPSASELVIRLLSFMGTFPSREVLTMLIAGILFDTKFLRLADELTLESLIWAMRLGGDYHEAQSILSSKEVSRAEKIAVLKGLSRSGLYTLNREWLVSITCIGSNESLVLKALIEAGADIAIAIAKRKEHNRVTVRASKKFLRQVDPGIAAEITKYLGKVLGGEGGGHGGAAGALINARASGKEVLEALKGFFESKGFRMRVLEEGKWLRECE